MSTKKNNKNIMLAALAGVAIGIASPTPAMAADQPTDVKCYGINGCGQQASCAVKGEDISAVQNLLGKKEFKARFAKSVAHECRAHASCGSGSKFLNWTTTSAEACQQANGILIEEVNGKKVAKKL